MCCLHLRAAPLPARRATITGRAPLRAATVRAFTTPARPTDASRFSLAAYSPRALDAQPRSSAVV